MKPTDKVGTGHFSIRGRLHYARTPGGDREPLNYEYIRGQSVFFNLIFSVMFFYSDFTTPISPYSNQISTREKFVA